jgi:imidazolonepropionase
VLEVGKRADLAAWNASDPAELTYWMGRRLCAARYVSGVRAPA